jgi:hypothetical protein
MSAINYEDRTSKRKNWARSLWPECGSCGVYTVIYIYIIFFGRHQYEYSNAMDELNMSIKRVPKSVGKCHRSRWAEDYRKVMGALHLCTEIEGVIHSVVKPEPKFNCLPKPEPKLRIAALAPCYLPQPWRNFIEKYHGC